MTITKIITNLGLISNAGEILQNQNIITTIAEINVI